MIRIISAGKYENPVASREYLMSLLKEHDKPLSFLDICNLVNAFDEEARIEIQRRLRAMEREGQVQFKQKKYILQNRDELIKGRIIGHRDGYGFLRPEDKSGDLFISAGQMNLFLHDDVVKARIKRNRSPRKKKKRCSRKSLSRSELVLAATLLNKVLAWLCQMTASCSTKLSFHRRAHTVLEWGRWLW